ncbi:MAG: phage tail protein, partial [Chloroflexota bacterium]
MPAQLVEAHANFRFAVSIDGINHAAFTECALPSLTVETQEIKEGGLNEYTHQLPVRMKVGTVTLKHGYTKDAALLTWYIQVLQGQLKQAMRTVSIVIYDNSFKIIMTLA